jgi:hypothetical protein
MSIGPLVEFSGTIRPDPVDLIAFFFSFLGITLASHGHILIGGIVMFAPLIAFAVSLGRLHRPFLFLPFSFVSWFVVLPLALLGMLMFRSPFFLGLAIYYYGCIALAERQAKYVPWGGGLGWKTATRAQRPVVYWLAVSLFFGLSAVALAAGFLSAIGQGGGSN